MTIKRQLSLTLDEEMAAQVETYMETHGIEKPASAVRGLVTEALAITPKDGVTIAAVRRAYNDVTRMLLESTGRFYGEMKVSAETYLREVAGIRYRCPHCNNEL